jgi:DNA repair photolyase
MPGNFEMMSRDPVNIGNTGDYQAVERRLGHSWRMLELCLELGFPVLALERPPLVLRDLQGPHPLTLPSECDVLT